MVFYYGAAMCTEALRCVQGWEMCGLAAKPPSRRYQRGSGVLSCYGSTECVLTVVVHARLGDVWLSSLAAETQP